MKLLDDSLQDYMQADLIDTMGRFMHAPFISILLWFDREITDLDHAWLLDTTIQWFFHKSRIRGYAPGSGSYVELVIAGSRSELPKSRAEILEPALAELKRFFPGAAKAKLVKSGILKEARATFSVTPGLDAVGPRRRLGFRGCFLPGTGRDGVAFDDGRRGAQRAAGGGCGAGRACEVSGAGAAGDGCDELAIEPRRRAV